MLEIHEVTKTYRVGEAETQALKGVSLSVESGEFVAIMGPSGSGKSTLMNVLGLLDTPTGGAYRIDGVDVSGLSETERAEARSHLIGFVFQSFNLLPRISVMRNVMLPLLYAGVPESEWEQRARNSMDAAGVPEEVYHKHSNQISGGQMQRVAIARSLVNDPALILADEPTGNLDTATGEFIMTTFKQLRDRGRTIVLITHEPDVAAYADRTLYIRDGYLHEGSERVGP